MNTPFELYKTIVKKFQTGNIVDIGACNYHTDNMQYFGKADFNILLIEPDPNQCKIIKEQISGLTNVSLVEEAVWNESKHIEFTISPILGHSRIENDYFKQAKPRSPIGQKVRVKASTYKEILERFPDFKRSIFVKIDVEGNDEIILEQVLPYKPNFVMIEHHYIKERMENQSKQLEESGYTVIQEFQDSNLWQL